MRSEDRITELQAELETMTPVQVGHGHMEEAERLKKTIEILKVSLFIRCSRTHLYISLYFSLAASLDCSLSLFLSTPLFLSLSLSLSLSRVLPKAPVV